MAFDELLAERVRESLLECAVAFEEKRMMGGLCFMVNDKMCLGIVMDRLMVRLDPAIYESALARRGCVPMDFTGRPMRGFVFVKPEGVKSQKELKSWIAIALEFNPRARASRRKPTGKRHPVKGSKTKTRTRATTKTPKR